MIFDIATWSGSDTAYWVDAQSSDTVTFINHQDPNVDFSSFWSRLQVVMQVTFAPDPVLGDFDRDGLLTAVDIDMLTAGVLAREDPPELDLNSDALVNAEDHRVWVKELMYT